MFEASVAHPTEQGGRTLFIILLESCSASAHGEPKKASITPNASTEAILFRDTLALRQLGSWYVSSLWFYEAVNATTLVYYEAASTEGGGLEPNWFLKQHKK